MAKILFILIYWSAFFFLRHFFKSYDLGVPDRVFNIVGGALFACLVLFYLLISAFFKAYLGAGRYTETARPRQSEPANKQASGTARGRKGEGASDRKEAPTETKEPEKKSRVRILRANRDD